MNEGQMRSYGHNNPRNRILVAKLAQKCLFNNADVLVPLLPALVLACSNFCFKRQN